MKKLLIILVALLVVPMVIAINTGTDGTVGLDLIPHPAFNYGGNYSINTNYSSDSDKLDGQHGSYFYPYSNPSNFLNTSNGGIDQIAFFNPLNKLTSSSNLTFNQTTNQLSINRNTAPISPPSITGTAFRINCGDNEICREGITSYGLAGLSGYSTRQARGTGQTPTASQSGDILGQFDSYGRGATGWSVSPRAIMKIIATENYDDSKQGARLSFWSTPKGSLVPTESMSIDDGNVTIFGNVTATYFKGNGSLLTGIPNPFDQTLNTTSNVKFNSTNISNSIINSSGMFIPTGKIYVGNQSATYAALRDISIIKDSNEGGPGFPSILIRNSHKSTGINDFSFAGFFFQANNSNVSFDMFADGSGFFNSGVSDVYFRVNTNHPLIFGTNNLQRLFIEKDGKVGIGQRANTYELEVNGDVSANNFYGALQGNSYGSHYGDVNSDYIYSQSDNTELASYDGSDWTVTAGQFNTKNITPQVTNTYSIGTYDYRYLKGWFNSLDILGNVNITGNLSITGLLIDNGNVNITGNLSVKNSYWTGYDNSTQNFINTANAQVINISNNLDIDRWQINVTNRQNLTFERTGDYSCTLSPQFFQNGGGSIVTFWIQKNGADVPWSNSRYSMTNNEYNAPSINFHFDIENPATDNIRFMWWSDSTNTQIYSSGTLTSPSRPSIPGIILNCLRI